MPKAEAGGRQYHNDFNIEEPTTEDQIKYLERLLKKGPTLVSPEKIQARITELKKRIPVTRTETEH